MVFVLSRFSVVFAVAAVLVFAQAGRVQPAKTPEASKKAPTHAELITQAVEELVKMQEPDGQWSYEGVYRVGGKIPVGYRVGGTATVANTLVIAVPENAKAKAAIAKGLAFVLKDLEDPLMAPSTKDGYDVRVWGHGCALEFLCNLRAAKLAGKDAKEVDTWITKLVETLITEEIDGGGWNYASRRQQACFVTAPITQSLLIARAQKEKVPDAVLERARKVLEKSRTENGAFVYSGAVNPKVTKDLLPGSIARSTVCETTLTLLGGSSPEAIQASVDAFHKYWDELEKRRKKTGTHVAPHMIAPYYFYYGHRYAAQAIEMLPEAKRQKERAKLVEVILKTRDPDGTWNDRVFERSRNYGTAMIVLALINERTPIPAKFEKK